MKIKAILLLLALCVTMGVSSQGRIEPGNEVAIKLYKEAAKKEKKNPAYSLAMYESLAKDGYAPAQYIMYKKGKGDKWLEQAAVGGHYEAAIDNGFLSQRIKLCEQVVERSRACATRARNGEAISKQEEQQLWDDRKVFDQFYHEMESMQGYLFSATIAEDVNFFPPYYKGKKDMQKAQCDLEVLCSSCRDRLAQLQMEFGQQMDIIKASAKKTAMTASANGQQADKTFTVKGVSFVMKSVAGGTFQMGATPEQNLSAWGNEKPAHSVTLSSYYIGQTEVTQALWQAVMGSNPSRSKGNNLPVETVTWDDCQTFITKLNQLTGQKFRLPTEAEWEYAARGGKNSKGYEYSGSKTLGDVAWFYENSGDSLLSSSWDGDKVKSNHCKTHPVATKQPNEIGIYDMCGNVEEWCQDWYGKEYYKNSPSKNPSGPTSGSDRVIRGGCWRNVRGNCRVSARNQMAPFISSNEFGLRLALSQTTSTSTATQKTTTASTSTPKTTMTAEEMLEMGEDYYGKQNYVEAVKWYRKAAEQGHALAQATLGVCYLEGTGITPNFTEAAKWFLKAAEQGQVEGQYAMGFCFYEGLGVTQSYTEAVKWLRRAAEQGLADAQCALGECYYEGLGVTQSYVEAVRWYRKAAEQGQADAQNRMGLCYHSGKGVTKDDAEAVKWYRKAAEQGYAAAQSNLGINYYEGTGVTQSYTEAVKWFRKAAEQGYVDAQNRMGLCYHSGKGVTKDDAEAVKWYRKAAEQGYAAAQYNLGINYYEGTGVTQSYTEAVKWFRKAAEQGYAAAQNRMGLCYHSGKGVTKDDAEAVKWYRKAAEQGYAVAQYNLGINYYEGTGVSQNKEEAKKWLRKAANQGYENAKQYLKKWFGEE